MGGGDVVIELLVAGAACSAVLVLVWWYDSRGPSEWEDLVSPEAREAHAFLVRKFRAEERVVDAFLSADFLAGLVPDRVALVRRLALYSRILAAIVPPPQRLRARVSVLRQAFAALRPKPLDRAREELRALDAETLESWRILALAVARPGADD